MKTNFLTGNITTRPVMRSEMNEHEIKTLRKAIFRHLTASKRFDQNGKLVMQPTTKMLCDDYLGLAYTSSSSWAGLWPCNVDVYADTEKSFTYGGFGMDMGGNCIAWLTDHDENEMYIYI
jgi:hypothetical protein